MKSPLLLLALFLLAALPGMAANPRKDVDSALAHVRRLKAMKPGESYTLPVNGQPLTGRKEAFLRARTAAEIEKSGLSCGCGDYAILFADLLRSRGYETLIVDSAQVSLLSLWSEFAGHAVVAVRANDRPKSNWWLVDSTAGKVLSEDWSTDAKSFVAGNHLYWIGYCGPLEGYPARTPQELRQFYRATLATVPPALFNRVIPRLNFTLDATLSLRDNPNIPRLTSEQERLFAKYTITPERTYDVRLTRGRNDTSGDLRLVKGEWVATVGLKSACSPSFLSYMAAAIARQQPERRNF